MSVCRINTSDLGFGVYNPLNTVATESVGNLSVDCSFEIGTAVIELGTGRSGRYTRRTMQSGNDTLAYNLYTDASRTRIFGNGSSGTAAIRFRVALFFSDSFSIYAAIPAGQDVAPGIYTDTIVATIRY